MAHFVSASLVIGCSIFLLLTVDGIGLGTLLYIFYTAAALSQLFIFCYGGTFVAESVRMKNIASFNTIIFSF